MSIFTIFSDIATIAASAKIQAETLDNIKGILTEIRNALVPKRAVTIRFDAVINGHKEVGIVGFQLQDIQSVPVTIVFIDADGNPTAGPAGVVPTWDTSDATKATVTPAADGMSAVVSGQSGLGDVQINVTAGALTGQLVVTVVAGPPASIQITPGTPTPLARR